MFSLSFKKENDKVFVASSVLLDIIQVIIGIYTSACNFSN